MILSDNKRMVFEFTYFNQSGFLTRFGVSEAKHHRKQEFVESSVRGRAAQNPSQAPTSVGTTSVAKNIGTGVSKIGFGIGFGIRIVTRTNRNIR